MPTYRLDLIYDGTRFHGFARQPGVRTVQGEIESVLARLAGSPIDTTAAGRTDAGVHAWGQVVSFSTLDPMDPARVVRSVNRVAGPEIAATSCLEAAPSFNARHSARWRQYRYRVLTSPSPDPLRRLTVWHVPASLDLAAMKAAAAGFVGEHDFASFCRAGRPTVRRVDWADWAREDDLLVFSIRASSFCHQMVRSLVGFCVDAGRSRVDPGSVAEVLAAADRAAAREPAPPRGLILWEVGY